MFRNQFVFLRTLAIFALAVSAATCANRPAVDVDEAREALQHRERDFLAAMQAKDLESTAAYFAESAVLHVANMPPVEGRTAIRQFYANVFRFLNSSVATPETLRMSSGADLAYSGGRVSNIFQGPQGPVQYAGKYLLVWEKRENVWSVVVYSVSNNRAEGEPVERGR